MSQRVNVAAGAAEFTKPETITYTSDISTADVKVSLAALNTTPTVWVTPTEDSSGDVKKRIVKLKIDNTYATGTYWLRARVTTASEVKVLPLTIVTVNATASSGTSAGSAVYFVNSTLIDFAGEPDVMAVGAITRGTSLGLLGAATGFAVTWPDGATGVYAGTESAVFAGAVDFYTVTHVLAGVTTTYTQPTLTRDPSSGVVTNRPTMTVA